MDKKQAILNNKYILVKGIAGLGNRLLTLTTAITYAKRTNRQIIVDWTEGQFAKKGENAFFKCFDLKNINYLESINDIENIQDLTIYPKAWKGLLHTHGNNTFDYKRIFIPYISKKIKRLGWKGEIAKVNGFWHLRKPVGNELTLKEKLFGILTSKGFPHGHHFSQKHNENLVVYMDYRPAINPEDFLQHITLKPHISSIIDEKANDLGLHTNAIGIHVRYTDKMPTKDIITIVDKVKRLELNDPLIFLATDNSDVYFFFKKHFSKLFSFGENVPKPPDAKKGIHHHFNDENSYEIFQQSIIDMWLLSKCEYLFYQGNSTFSIISKYLHKDKSKVFNWMAD